MKYVIFKALVLVILPINLSADKFEEQLWVKTLPSGHVHAHFEFLIRDLHSSNLNHTRLFPRAIMEILSAHAVNELHFSLTQGYWRTESWGEPVIAAPTGAHVVAWFLANDSKDADRNWKGLTSRLSGLTCASVNFLDEKTSIEPKYAYRPVGVILNSDRLKNAFVRVGSLPREHICTENLTPWAKQLPCGISRGLSSLLRSKKVFDTHYLSAGIHYTQTSQERQMKFSLSLVFDPIANKKPSENFARKVLGSLGIYPCKVADISLFHYWNNNAWKTIRSEESNPLKIGEMLSIPESKVEKNLVFTAQKYMGGYGQKYGEMSVQMTNHLRDKFLPVLYTEVLPWYVRPYLHTMKAQVVHNGNSLSIPSGDLFHYTPGRDRQMLHKIEIDFSIPPQSTVFISFDIEKGHLKWDEYPPDANHGFYLDAAHFEVNITTGEKTETRHYFSRILLINLSTPDFSMPYNVICLTCTVVALSFGPIHNITTKRLKLRELTSKSEKFKKYWSKFFKKKENPAAEQIKEELKSSDSEEKIVESEKSNNGSSDNDSENYDVTPES